MNKTAETFSKCASELTWRGVLGFLAAVHCWTRSEKFSRLSGIDGTGSGIWRYRYGFFEYSINRGEENKWMALEFHI
jgi:glucan phosphorylase